MLKTKKKSIYQTKMDACCVMHVTFIDGNIRTFWDWGYKKRKGDVWYWVDHLRNMAENKEEWAGRVREWVIYPVKNGERDGTEHILKSVTYSV